MKILSAEQLAEADQSTISKQHLTSVDLMERAGTLVFERIHQRLKADAVLVKLFCGSGNNGGDGLVIARHLINHGYQVIVYITNCSTKRSPNFLINYNRIKEVAKDWPILLSCKEDFPEITAQDIVIDAIFGTGLNRVLEGWVADLVHYLNDSNALKVAIDMPSGLYANKAHDPGDAILKADHTFTFQTPKLSFFLPETGSYVGSFEVVNIGLDPAYLMGVAPLAELIDREAAQNRYKTREKFTYKGDYGHVLTFAGSKGKMGAAVLCAGAAINSGAGKVTAYIPEEGNYMLQTSLPEVMTLQSKGDEFITDFNHDLKDYVLCIGPGIGTEKDTVSAFAKAIQEQTTPIIIDADGIVILSQHPELVTSLPKDSILTPHDGELRQLIGPWNHSYERIRNAQEFSKKHGVILVLKGAHSMIISPSGSYINDTGNPGMATAGSGDVLSGILASFLAQGYDPISAAIFSVYIHGASGDLAAQTYAYEGLKASVISNYIGPSILDLLKNPIDQQQ
ncbi:NAD(P)H-hydrate dehydratase [Nonlabens sp.]|uniref:NAD(P)H-hydrate dehydratase n=1 Tax=Nonlabens sp. TaxID=1888209 RepID=UPI0025ECFC64|nr:NAD(P)H-hydrate dehydratase [Nonlabens sp.]